MACKIWSVSKKNFGVEDFALSGYYSVQIGSYRRGQLIDSLRTSHCLRIPHVIVYLEYSRHSVRTACLALEDGNDRLYRNVGNYQCTLRNISEELRSYVHCGRSLNSSTFLLTFLTSLTSYDKFLSITLCQNFSSYFWQMRQLSIYKFYFLINIMDIKSIHLEICSTQEYFLKFNKVADTSLARTD